jgi:hypothetical protein
MIVHWNQTYSNGSEINDDTVLSTPLFANDQVILSDSEDDLQTALYTLHNITEQFGIKTTLLKSKGCSSKK